MSATSDLVGQYVQVRAHGVLHLCGRVRAAWSAEVDPVPSERNPVVGGRTTALMLLVEVYWTASNLPAKRRGDTEMVPVGPNQMFSIRILYDDMPGSNVT